MNPTPPRTDSSAADDTLRQQLQALTPRHAPVAALGDRVLAQWHELHPEAALQPAGRNGAALLLPLHATRCAKSSHPAWAPALATRPELELAAPPAGAHAGAERIHCRWSG